MVALLGCAPENTADTTIVQTSFKREIVAPGIISLPDRHEFGSILTHDGEELYIAIEHGEWASIVSYRRDGDEWVGPYSVIGSPELSTNDPMFSPDGKRLYFIAPRSGQYDIGYIERRGDSGWGEVVWAPRPINSSADEYYVSFTRDDDLIFSTNRNAEQENDFDIVRARKSYNGKYDLVAFPDTINTAGYEADAFVDPDGRYLIFGSNRPDGLGRGDLYISFADEQGDWAQAIPLGDAVNTAGHELCPFVSSDGKWLYFTSDGDIYRISADIIRLVEARALRSTWLY